MTACANVRPGPEEIPAEFFTCAAPAPYPASPDAGQMVMALTDTYLAWEDCHGALARLRDLSRGP